MWHSVDSFTTVPQRTGPGIRFHTLGCFFFFGWPSALGFESVASHLMCHPSPQCAPTSKITHSFHAYSHRQPCLTWNQVHVVCLRSCKILSLVFPFLYPPGLCPHAHAYCDPSTSHSNSLKDLADSPSSVFPPRGQIQHCVASLRQSRTPVLHNLPPPWIWASNSQNCFMLLCCLSIAVKQAWSHSAFDLIWFRLD